MSNTGGIKKNIPNIITLVNLGCGTLAINYIFQQNWNMVCVLIGIAAIADFADGLVARVLKVTSPIGKELDSLSDMVSFGVVPGLILFQLLLEGDRSNVVAALPALFIPLAASLRLAKFNTEEDTSGDFIGLSTPACTALIIGIILIIYKGEYPRLAAILQNPTYLYIIIACASALLISNFSMFSLKFESLKWQGNEIRWIFILVFILLSFTIHWSSIFTIIILYILVSIIQHLFFKQQA